MANYFPATIAQARTQSTQVSVTATPEPKLWSTELFQLSAMGAVVAFLMLWASLSQKKPQLTSARMVNRGDKVRATEQAFSQMKATANGKCSPSAAWVGTPKYFCKFLGSNWAAKLQAMLFNTGV